MPDGGSVWGVTFDKQQLWNHRRCSVFLALCVFWKTLNHRNDLPLTEVFYLVCVCLDSFTWTVLYIHHAKRGSSYFPHHSVKTLFGVLGDAGLSFFKKHTLKIILSPWYFLMNMIFKWWQSSEVHCKKLCITSVIIFAVKHGYIWIFICSKSVIGVNRTFYAALHLSNHKEVFVLHTFLLLLHDSLSIREGI